MPKKEFTVPCSLCHQILPFVVYEYGKIPTPEDARLAVGRRLIPKRGNLYLSDIGELYEHCPEGQVGTHNLDIVHIEPK